jgi:hypothetical protein
MFKLTSLEQRMSQEDKSKRPAARQRDEPIPRPILDVEEDLTQFWEKERQNALSAGHFATLVMKNMFTEEEQDNKNCCGKKGNEALDPKKLELIRKLVFNYYDVSVNDQGNVWKICISRMDE